MHAHLIRGSIRHQNLPDFLPFLSPNPPTYLFRPQILSALLPQWADFRLLPILSLLAQPWELSRPMPHSAVILLLHFTGHVFCSDPSPQAGRMSPGFEWRLRPSVLHPGCHYIPHLLHSLWAGCSQLPPFRFTTNSPSWESLCDSRLVTAHSQLPQHCSQCPSSSVSTEGGTVFT